MKQFNSLKNVIDESFLRNSLTSPKNKMSKMLFNSPNMNQIVCFLLLQSIMFFYNTTNAQINLEHTFNEGVNWNGSYYFDQNLYPSNCFYLSSIVDNTYVVKIYKADYSVYSNNTYNFTPPTGYKVYNVSMSRNLFNTDNNYEFLIIYHKITSISDNKNTKCILYNQDGSVIKDFGTADNISTYPLLLINNNKLFFYITKFYYNGTISSYNVEIYSVPGTPPAGIANLKSNGNQLPYPNPAKSVIALPYQLKNSETANLNIFNMNGKLIEIKQIDSAFDKILLNVSNYPKGTYIYDVNGERNKFIVE